MPDAYVIPVAVLLAIGGLLACFAGYRLFRIVLGVYGFVLGAIVTTSILGPVDAWTLTMGVVVGGIVGTVLAILAYFLGVGLVGAGLAVLLLHAGWRFVGGEIPTILVVVVAVIGALSALSIAKIIVITGTSLAGAWTMMVGALALAGDQSALGAAAARDVWVLYPLDPDPGRAWVTGAWLLLSLAGVSVQFTMNQRKKRTIGPPTSRR